MPRPSLEFVRKQFKSVQPPNGVLGNKTVCYSSITIDFKGQAACKHCGHKLSAINTTRKTDHLIKECPSFLEYARLNGIQIVLTQKAKALRQGQQKLHFPSIPADARKTCDLAFAKVCYVQALPFNVYESEAMKDALKTINPAYNPPNRIAVGGRLLDATDEALKVQVQQKIATLEHINIISDESTDINSSRILNICLHTPNGALHWLFEDVRDKRLTADNISTMLRDRMNDICQGRLERLNSLSTDTCETMLNTHRQLRQYPELKHLFFIPCDSHGLQLLIKDVLSFSIFKPIIEKAQSIVKAFKKSPLQLAHLCNLQEEIYGCRKSLCLSVITRWGTQYRLVESVLNSKDALRRYLTARSDTDKPLPYNALEYIDNIDLTF